VISKNLKWAAPALVAGVVVSSAGTATPLANSMGVQTAAEPLTEQVHWRGRGRGWGFAAGGFAAGALIGSALARPYYAAPYYNYGYYPQPYYPSAAYYPSYPVYPPTPPIHYYGTGYGGGYVGAGYGDDGVAYCMRRFRSYDPVSQTFVGKDGRRRPCP
jgi:hypothetical protein